MTDLRREIGTAVKWPTGYIAAFASCAAIVGTLLWKPAPALLWNASPSSPIGLYWVHSRPTLRTGEIAIAWPPAAAARLAARRHYLPVGVPLVKHIAAVAGARVCAKGPIVFVNDRPAAFRRFRDRAGRRLPWWSGCHTLRNGELFLLSPGMPEAFDGRYFGITRGSDVIGVGKLLWQR